MIDIVVAPFLRNRQTADSRFSHFEGDWETLRRLAVEHFHKARPSRSSGRDGIVLITVPPEGFYSAVVQLKAGDKLAGTYEPRKENEDPRKGIGVIAGPGRKKLPAKHVDLVVYRHDVLAENDEHSCDADWEIISINASPTEGEMPMRPGTLMANHFELSGGTATGMNDAEFIVALRASMLYWSDKALLLPAEEFSSAARGLGLCGVFESGRRICKLDQGHEDPHDFGPTSTVRTGFEG